MTSKKGIYSINEFNELRIKSTINDSDGDDAESNPSSDPKVATYTTNRKSPQKLFNNRFIPDIIPGAIRPIDQMIMEGVTGIRETLDEWSDSALEGDHHGRGTQWRAHFLESEGGNPDEQGHLHTTGHQHCRKNCQVDSPN